MNIHTASTTTITTIIITTQIHRVSASAVSGKHIISSIDHALHFTVGDVSSATELMISAAVIDAILNNTAGDAAAVDTSVVYCVVADVQRWNLDPNAPACACIYTISTSTE